MGGLARFPRGHDIERQVGASHVQCREKSTPAEETCSAKGLRWERNLSVPGTDLEQEERGERKEIKTE